jgi:soluble lytic murein transglycosylase
MIKAGFWNDTELRFPLSFEELFEKNSKINQIPKHLLIALARQESAFHVEATSPVGAKGLMQLMPRTAKQVASKNNIIFDTDDGLYDPKINIALGSLYFGKMLKRFDGNRILAIASYNAGPTRVRRWEKQTKGEIPFDAWIESIPFNETRNYVQNVLAFAVIYAKKLGAGEQMINEQEKIKKL